MKKFIILLDGAKGAGKSTVTELLRSRLSQTIFLDWGSIWRAVSDKKPKDEDDPTVLEEAMKLMRSYLNSDMNIFLDNHLTAKRTQAIDLLGKECGAKVLKYHLTAPPEVLLERVRQRDVANGKPTNEERFYSMYTIQQSKDFSEFRSFDTTTMSPESIANTILQDLNND